MYVFFGPVLMVLALALYDRLREGAPALAQALTVVAIIWAGSLVARGKVEPLFWLPMRVFVWY